MPPPRIEPGFQQPQCCVLTTILRWQMFITKSGAGTIYDGVGKLL